MSELRCSCIREYISQQQKSHDEGTIQTNTTSVFCKCKLCKPLTVDWRGKTYNGSGRVWGAETTEPLASGSNQQTWRVGTKMNEAYGKKTVSFHPKWFQKSDVPAPVDQRFCAYACFDKGWWCHAMIRAMSRAMQRQQQVKQITNLVIYQQESSQCVGRARRERPNSGRHLFARCIHNFRLNTTQRTASKAKQTVTFLARSLV